VPFQYSVNEDFVSHLLVLAAKFGWLVLIRK
jgi:hypothetical protein